MKKMKIDKVGLAIMLLFSSSMIPVLYVGAVGIDVSDAKTTTSYRKPGNKYDPRVARIVFSSAPRPDCPQKSN